MDHSQQHITKDIVNNVQQTTYMVHFSQYQIPQETFIFVTNVTNSVVLLFSSPPTIFHREHFQFNLSKECW